uniref:WH1 domain-containing protein n=1 Tax=Plectus sambesii TaxID=2011161 RepID=A0A914W7M3_9BILA
MEPWASAPDAPASPKDLRKFLAYTLALCKREREQPMLTTSSQIFTLDTSGSSATWIEQSSQPVTVHLYHDSARQMYRLISVQGSKPVLNLAVSQSLVINKASSKFLQLVDPRNTAVFGLGFTDERELAKFVAKLTEVQNVLNDSTSEVESPQKRLDLDHSTEHDTAPDVDNSLRVENARLKGALAESCNNAKKWERELAMLKEINKQLTEALKQAKRDAGTKTRIDSGDAIDSFLTDMKKSLEESTKTSDSDDERAVADRAALLDKLQGLLAEHKKAQEASTFAKEMAELRALHEQMANKLEELSELHKLMGTSLCSEQKDGTTPSTTC